jgi:rhamnosyltransferase
MTAIEHRSVGVAVITHKAVSLLPLCLPALLASPMRPRVLVVNSSSNDGTVELAEALGAETLVIPRSEFNHGSTRERARHALGTDIAVMITPDARPLGPELVGNLVRPIADGLASVSYARQLPHDGADFFEAFPRRFNYPDTSELRSISDVKSLGAYAFFCSDSCAAWSNAALDAVGGFEPTLSLEDTIAAAKLLRAGHRIAYCADAVVKHSHRYSLLQEFRRHFDTGYVRALHRDLLLGVGSDERRGAAYSSLMLRELARAHPLSLPYGVAVLGSKYLGYRAGFHGHSLPTWMKKRVSGQDYFWVTKAAAGIAK